MKLAGFFLDELEREAGATRRVLERVPEGRNDWKPHAKSMPLGYLAALVAIMPAWIAMMITQDELDVGAPGASSFKPPAWSTNGDLLRLFEDSMPKGRRALSETTEEHLLTPWRFLMGGRVVSENPRYVMIRDAALNHWVHHRAQLTVYLRLNDVAVPSIYGPSADEARG
jgi:uncharacterized damage-inducible protein DinB